MALKRNLDLDSPAVYQIRVKGELDESWTTWFDDLTVTTTPDETIITGLVADQSALHGLLIKVRDLGLPLIAVSRMEPRRPG